MLPLLSCILGANPFPEVTDLSCRLPLPTLFCWLDAFSIGNLLRFTVRASARERDLNHLFKSQAPDFLRHERSGAFRYDFLLFPSVKLFNRAEIPQKETINSSGAGTQRWWFRHCFASFISLRLGRGMFTHSLSEILDQLDRSLTEPALIQAFKHFLRIDWPMFNRCWHGNLFHFSLQRFSLNIRYYNQDLY